MLSEFINKLAIKQYSQYTIKSYQRILSIFLDKYNPTESDAKEYIKSLSTCGKSKNLHISAIRSYFKFCGIPNSLKNEKEFNKAIVPISKEQMEDILNPKHYSKESHHALFCFLYETGIRVGELCTIKKSDINGNGITVKGKGNKERLVFVSHEMIEKLNTLSDTEYICPYKYSYVKKMITDYLKDFKRVGLVTSNKLSPHGIRHSFATHLNNNGAPIVAIKNMMGHSSIETTSRYTHINIDELKKQHKKLIK